MKLVYQYMAIVINFSPTLSHLHPLQVENCDSNSRLVVDEYDNGKFRLERVKVKLYSPGRQKHQMATSKEHKTGNIPLLLHNLGKSEMAATSPINKPFSQ